MITQIVGALIARNALNNMGKTVQSGMKRAQKVGSQLGVEWGNQLNLNIERLKNAYLDSLDLTIDKVDALFLKHLETLNDMVLRFESSTLEGLGKFDATLDDLKGAALIIPFSNKQPQLSSFSPRVIVLSSNKTQFRINFHGFFAFADQEGFTPSLTLQGHTFNPSQNLTKELQFLISTKVFETVNFKESSIVPATLTIPWSTRGYFTDNKQQGIYNILFQVLPEYVANISIELLRPKITREVRQATRIYNFSSSSFEVLVKPETGWTIDINTAQIQCSPQNSRAAGMMNLFNTRILHQRGDSILYRVMAFGGWQANIQVVFNEFRDVLHAPSEQIETPFKWGESRIFEIGPDTKWKIKIHDFMGNEYPSVESDLTTPFIQIKSNASKLLVFNQFLPQDLEAAPTSAKL